MSAHLPDPTVDVTDPGEVERHLRAERPEVVVHCAAYTAVDRAEEESDQAMSVNRDGTRNVALAAAQIGATVVYPSTDFVFDGRADTPYRPDDETSPLSAYGVSKLAGEQVLAVSGCRLDDGPHELAVRARRLGLRGCRPRTE